jgi:hypothetical protein
MEDGEPMVSGARPMTAHRSSRRTLKVAVNLSRSRTIDRVASRLRHSARAVGEAHCHHLDSMPSVFRSSAVVFHSTPASSKSLSLDHTGMSDADGVLVRPRCAHRRIELQVDLGIDRDGRARIVSRDRIESDHRHRGCTRVKWLQLSCEDALVKPSVTRPQDRPTVGT